MTGREGVRASMPVRRGVAAAHVPAGEAESEVHPWRAQPEALLTALRRARRDRPDLFKVTTDRDGHLSGR